MKTNQFGLKKIRPNYAESMDSNFIEPQLVRVRSIEQVLPGILHWGGEVDWECGNCGARVSTPYGVTPDHDSGCPYGRHAWYKA